MTKSNGKEKEKEKKQEGQRQSRAVTPFESGAMGRGMWPLARLRTEFDRLFDDFFRGWGGLPSWPQPTETGWALDVDDEQDKVVIRAEAPGFEPKDFDVQVRDDQLVLTAHQSEPVADEPALC